MPVAPRFEPFFPRFILPAGLLVVTYALNTATPDPFHAWRWCLLSLFAALGLGWLFTRGSLPATRLSLAHARLPLLLTGAFLLFSLISLGQAVNRAEGFWQVAQNVAWGAWFLLALAAGAQYPPLWRILRLLAVAAALLGAGVAILEYWGLSRADETLGLGPGGLHGNRNLLASFQFLLCPWILWAILEERGGWRVLAGLAWMAFGYVLAITQSRAAWLGLAVMAAAALLLVLLKGRSAVHEVIRNRRNLLLGLLLPLAVAFLFHGGMRPAADIRPGSLERLASVADPGFASNAQRLALWRKTLTLIGEHPWSGVGPGNWKIALPSAGMSGLLWSDMSTVEVRPYNDWLWAASETGIPGGLCWFGVWLAALAAGARAALRPGHPALGFPVLLLTAGLAGFGALACFDFPRERPEHMAWYALTLAALLSLGNTGVTMGDGRDRARFRARFSPRFPVRLAFGLAFLPAAAAAGFACARWRCETDVRQVLTAHRAKDWPAVWAAVDRIPPSLGSLNPAASPLAWHEGIARHQMGDREGAEWAFARALRYHPWHVPTLYNLAVCRVQAGDTAGALGYLRRALDISPGFSEAALSRAVLSLRRGELAPARRALDGVEASRRGEKWQTLNRLLASHERISE